MHFAQISAVIVAQAQDRAAGAEHLFPKMRKSMAGRIGINRDGFLGRLRLRKSRLRQADGDERKVNPKSRPAAIPHRLLLGKVMKTSTVYQMIPALAKGPRVIALPVFVLHSTRACCRRDLSRGPRPCAGSPIVRPPFCLKRRNGHQQPRRHGLNVWFVQLAQLG